MSVTICHYILASKHIKSISHITELYIYYIHTLHTHTYSLPAIQPLVSTLSSTRSGNNQQANLSIVADILPRCATVYLCT